MERLDDSNSKTVCTDTSCIDDDDDKKITCTKCKRSVHFLCTNLPIYQLRLFFTKNYRGFICVNCVQVPEEFQEIFKNQDQTMIDKYKREVNACENIIMIQRENESKLINGIKKMKEKQNKKESQEKEKDLVNLIENKFIELEDRIKESIKNSIKTNEVNEKKNDEKSSFANIVADKKTILPEFRKILRDEKLKELEEERQHDLRQSNIIIFGVKEGKESKDDAAFVAELINNVGADSHVKFMTRIGEKSSNKNRPIKVVLGSAHERYLLMKNLANLKGKSTYKGISITEDFTVFERGLIKEWANKAKERTKEENDSGFVWRVRGSPFKGLYLKKIKKNNSIKC